MALFNAEFLHSQVFWTGLAFFTTLGLIWWKLVPAFMQVLDERSNKIREDLENAEDLRKQAEEALANYEKQIKAAKDEATKMVAKAREDADKLLATRTAELETELTRRTEEANKAIEQSKAKALDDVRTQLSDLVLLATEQVVNETVDAKKASKMTDDLLKNLN